MDALDSLFSLCTQYSRFVLPVLALWVLLRCVRSMFRETRQSEVWARLTPAGGDALEVRAWETILGRAKISDVVLPSPAVSRIHAVLVRGEAGRWMLYDLHTKSGTLVNGQRVGRKGTPVKSGDTLTLADTALTFTVLDRGQITALGNRRAVPGRVYRSALTLLLLTLFQAVMALDFALGAQAECLPGILTGFGALAAVEWLDYLIMRAIYRSGFEPETLAYFLCSLGMGVAAVSAPENMLRQCLFLVAGVTLYLLLGWWLRDLRRVKALRWPAAIGALGLLALNLLLSTETFGARNWLTLAGVSFQPSEFVKAAYIFAGAATADRLYRHRNLILFIGFSAACVGALALMGDFGTAVIFFAAFLLISYLRSGSLATVALAVTAAVLCALLVLSVKPYIAARFSAWGHIWEDPYDAGWQQTRALAAASSGGLFGLGAGQGWLHTLFAASSDLVFCLLCEEYGLLTALMAVCALLLLVLFAAVNAAACRSAYYLITSCAAAGLLLVQMALNVLGAVDILPFTGVTFPFVSAGGSSLLSCWLLLAFIKAGDTRRQASFAVRTAERALGKGGAQA